jgi:hypothetical protein
MKKPTLGQASLGFFAIVSLCFFLSALISSLDSVLEIVVWPSFLLAIFFLVLALANQVKNRGQMAIAVVIAGSSFLALAVPALLTFIGSFNPPNPEAVANNPLSEIEKSLDILKIYSAIFSVFFFSVIAGLLVSAQSLNNPGDVVSKVGFISVAASLIFTLLLIFGLVSFFDNIKWVFVLTSATLLLAAITGIFRLEAKRDPKAKSSISFDDQTSSGKSPVIPPPAKPTTAPPPVASQKVDRQVNDLPKQEVDLVIKEDITDRLVDQESSSHDTLSDETSPFAANLTQLSNPVFEDIKQPSQKDQPELDQNLEEVNQASQAVINPGWYRDPSDSDFIRYWDGSTWTSHRQPKNT